MFDQTERGNRYALTALKQKRSELAGEIQLCKRKIKWAEEQLRHVDATLRLLDPDAEPSKIPPAQLKHVKLFKQGELSRYVLDALRRAGEPVSTPQLVGMILTAMGHGEEARRAVAPRVRGNLAYHEKRGTVVKTGEGSGARWGLSAPASALPELFASDRLD